MTRQASGFAVLLLLAALSSAAAAAEVPSQASSRIRNLAGRMETFIRADAEAVVLDSIAVRSILLGYAEVGTDRDNMRLRLEKPATMAEVTSLGRSYEGTEVKRLQFEVVRAKKSPGRLRVVAAITLAANPGTAEFEQDVSKRQPFRNELKTLMDGIKKSFGP
jgi:hypothetical protein